MFSDGTFSVSRLPRSVFGAGTFRQLPDIISRHGKQLLIVTGGKLPGDRYTEAATARRYAVDHGVPPGAILGETKGRNTIESIEAVAEACRSWEHRRDELDYEIDGIVIKVHSLDQQARLGGRQPGFLLAAHHRH